MNQFILLSYANCIMSSLNYEEWECIGMFDSEQDAIGAMNIRLNDDWEDARGWKWESYATIEGNKVIHSESKDVWSAYEIVKIKLPKIESC